MRVLLRWSRVVYKSRALPVRAPVMRAGEKSVMECALNADSVFGGSLSAEPYSEDRCALDGIAEDLLSAGVPDFSEVPVEDGCLGFDRDPFCLEAVDNDVSVGGRTPACMSTDYYM